MSEIKVDTLTGKTTANDITVTVGASATQSLEQGLAKAWCHYEGDAATVSIIDGLNHASITDLTSGRYSVTFTNSMNSVYYASHVCGSTTRAGSNDTDSHATTGITHEYFYASGTRTDPKQGQSSIFGDLA
jgi:hypothetical protein